MEGRTETQRRRPADNYWLNVVQIPMLRALGLAILCVYVLLYVLLLGPPFSLAGYLAFVAISAVYCLASWLALRKGYRKIKPVDFSLVLLVADLFLWLLVVHRTGAEKSLLFFVGVVLVSHQAYTTFKRILIFAHLTAGSYLLLMLYLAVIEGILELSTIEARKLELHPGAFRLRDTLNDTLEVLAARAAQKDLELACQVSDRVPDFLIGDEARLRQVLMHLVGNAIKFTDRGEVFVRVDIVASDRPVPNFSVYEKPSPDSLPEGEGFLELHFVVRDTGIGIPKEKQQIIFESFVQADGSTTRQYGGTGLGLAICSQLVKLMGGRIWVESQVERGSSFHFTVQLCADESATDD